MPPAPSPIAAPAPRLASVDALRGITVAAMLLVNNPGDWGHVYAPLLHAQWRGLTPTDLIFPLFLFVVGVSTTLALVPRLEHGDPPAQVFATVAIRAARIVGLGLLLHLCALGALDLPHFRIMGVLQRIGICFLFAGALVAFCRARTQWIVWALLLVGYALLLAWGGSDAPFENIASRVDHAVLGVHVYQLDPVSGGGHDPEGLVSTLGAFATTLLGVRAGEWLQQRRVDRLAMMGMIALVAGQTWSSLLPLNKNLWTPSYVLWTGGVACVLLWSCHLLIDRRGWPAWGRAFGVNAIAAYGGSAFLLYALAALGWLAPIYQHGFADWITPRWGAYAASLAYAIAFVALWWGIVRALDARRVYFKI